MKGRWLVLAGVAIALVGAIAWFVWHRRPESPEDQIKHEVVEMARAAEKKDLGFVMERVSPGFQSAEGWTKDDLKAFLAAQMFRGDWMRVFIAEMQVGLNGPDRAFFSGKFVMGRSDAQTIKELAAKSEVQGYQIDAALHRDADGEWRFVTAAHRPIDPSQFLH